MLREPGLAVLEKLDRIGELKDLVAELETRGPGLEGAEKVRLNHARGALVGFASELRAGDVQVCRRCYCTEWTACVDLEAPLVGCSWYLPDLCSACIQPELEERYLATVHAIGVGDIVPCASAAQAGDVIVREMLEERLVEVDWTGDEVSIATATRSWVFDPGDHVMIRRVPRSWAGLLEPLTAEQLRRELVLEAFAGDRLFHRERAERLLGIDLETGEVLGEAAHG